MLLLVDLTKCVIMMELSAALRTAPTERVTLRFTFLSSSITSATLPFRQCHDALLHQIRTRDTVTPMIETSIAVVGMTLLATDAMQTVIHATGTGTAEDTQSGIHGEVITMIANSTTMTNEGGTKETINIEGKMGTTVMMMVDGEGTKAVETSDTQADTKKVMIKALGRRRTAIEATVSVCESTAIAVSVATSVGGVLRDVPHHLDVHVRILAHTRHLVHNLHHHPPKTRPSPISRHRACLRPRRTRLSIQTERALCLNTMSRLRLADLLLGGGFTFLRVMSKSVRSPPSFSFPTPVLISNSQSVQSLARVIL